jgi:MFS transporter, YNFM family, putative membrane transport protein
MSEPSCFRLQIILFALVSASFTNIYSTQPVFPVLPVLQQTLGADLVRMSFTVSAAIFGITLTICLAAYLAKTLPMARLNVVMGSYVAPTVLGGLGRRLLGGWIHPRLHWRYAFFTAAVFILTATIIAVKGLPREKQTINRQQRTVGFIELLKRRELILTYFCAAGAFLIFSSIFNYLPYRLKSSAFNYSTEQTTLVYLVYVVGLFMGPMAGRISNRWGNGNTLIGGTIVLVLSLASTLLPSIVAVVFGLLAVCGGFFTIHAAAVGSLNRKLNSGQGRANALYVLFYYVGGWLGITVAGLAYERWDWKAVIHNTMVVLIIPLSTGPSSKAPLYPNIFITQSLKQMKSTNSTEFWHHCYLRWSVMIYNGRAFNIACRAGYTEMDESRRTCNHARKWKHGATGNWKHQRVCRRRVDRGAILMNRQ